MSELGEVSLAALAEQHLEVRDGGLEKREDRFQRLPLPVVVFRRRHVAEGEERLAQARDLLQVLRRGRPLQPLAVLPENAARQRFRGAREERLRFPQEAFSLGRERRFQLSARRRLAGLA